MSNLSAFLSQNAAKQENVQTVVSKRFTDGGKPIQWEIRAITAAEEEDLRKSCTRRVAVPGRKGQYTAETDQEAYIRKMAASAVVFPNLNDAELQNSYGVMGAEQLLLAMLLPGEYADLLTKVQDLSGYNIGMDDLVDDAKN